MPREDRACGGEKEHPHGGWLHASSLQPLCGTASKCCTMQNFDRQDFAVDTFNNTLNLLLRIGRFQSAIILLRRMIALFTKLQQEHNMSLCSPLPHPQLQVLSLDRGDLSGRRRPPRRSAGVQPASPVVSRSEQAHP